jgi:hypothetical protein
LSPWDFEAQAAAVRVLGCFAASKQSVLECSSPDDEREHLTVA